MKQGIASKFVSFSALSLSLVASFAVNAQLIEVETPPADGEEGAKVESASAPQASVPEALLGQQAAPAAPVANTLSVPAGPATIAVAPVAVSNAMVPQSVPQAVPQQAPAQVAPVAAQQDQTQQFANASQSQSQTVQSGANNPMALPSMPAAGNANSNSGSGQQIIIVPSLQSAQNTNQESAQAMGDPLGDMRMNRARHEGFNDGLLLRRLEEGRIQDERERTKSVDAFTGSVTGPAVSAGASASADASVLETIPVTNGEPQASASATATATVSGVSAYGQQSSGVEFKITPFGGYRWYENNRAQYKVNNDFVAGVQLEGAITDYLAIEGSFTYGRDSFAPNAYGQAGYGNYGYNGGYAQQGPYAYNSYQTSGYNNGLLPMPSARDSYEVSTGVKAGTNLGKVRPYAAVGIGGLFQRYRIDQVQDIAWMQQVGLQRASNYVLGNFGAGLDVRVAKNFSIGSRFDYQALLNAKPTIYNQIWGDALNRMRLTGNMSLVF